MKSEKKEYSGGRQSYLPGNGSSVERSILCVESEMKIQEIDGFLTAHRRTITIAGGRNRSYKEVDPNGGKDVKGLSYLVGRVEDRNDRIVNPGARKAVVPLTRKWGPLTNIIMPGEGDSIEDKAVAYQLLESSYQDEFKSPKDSIEAVPEDMFGRLKDYFGETDYPGLQGTYERIVESEEKFNRKARRDMLRITSDYKLYNRVEDRARGLLRQYMEGITERGLKGIDGAGKFDITPGKLREFEERAFGREIDPEERYRIAKDVFRELPDLDLSSIGSNLESKSRKLAESIMDRCWQEEVKEVEGDPGRSLAEEIGEDIEVEEARRLGYGEEAANYLKEKFTKE